MTLAAIGLFVFIVREIADNKIREIIYIACFRWQSPTTIKSLPIEKILYIFFEMNNYKEFQWMINIFRKITSDRIEKFKKKTCWDFLESGCFLIALPRNLNHVRIFIRLLFCCHAENSNVKPILEEALGKMNWRVFVEVSTKIRTMYGKHVYCWLVSYSSSSIRCTFIYIFLFAFQWGASRAVYSFFFFF